jgi:hypothetical protein
MPNTNQKVVPQAKAGLDKLKYEIASEVGVTLSQGYNGNIAARDAGRIGGNMVKRMIAMAEQSLAGRQ